MQLTAIDLIDVVKKFDGAFINNNYELILYPETNVYINIRNTKDLEELKCKVIEYASRSCYKSQPFDSERKNNLFRKRCLDCLNNYLQTNFDNEDMEIIYQKLGNSVNRDLTIKFVRSDYDMKVLGKRGLTYDRCKNNK